MQKLILKAQDPNAGSILRLQKSHVEQDVSPPTFVYAEELVLVNEVSVRRSLSMYVIKDKQQLKLRK